MAVDLITGKVSEPVNIPKLASLLTCKTDTGACCTALYINMWARWKPLKINQIYDITNIQATAKQYGLKQNVGVKGSTVNNSDYKPYLYYDRMTGAQGEYYRITDFLVPYDSSSAVKLEYPGYNHKAICPVKATTEWTQTINIDTGPDIAEIDFPNMFISHSVNPNVEIPVSFLTSFVTASDVFGIFFWNENAPNASTGRFYYAFPYTLQEILDGEVEYPWRINMNSFLMRQAGLQANDGDKIHMYYCTIPDIDKPSEEVLYYQKEGYANAQILAPSECCGHGVITIRCFNINKAGDNYYEYNGQHSGYYPSNIGYSGISSNTITGFTHYIYAPSLIQTGTAVQPIIWESIILSGDLNFGVLPQEYEKQVTLGVPTQTSESGHWMVSHTFPTPIPVDDQQTAPDPEAFIEVWITSDPPESSNRTWRKIADGRYRLHQNYWYSYIGIPPQQDEE